MPDRSDLLSSDPTLRATGILLPGALLWIAAIGCLAAALLIGVALRHPLGRLDLVAAAVYAIVACLSAAATRLAPRHQGQALTAVLVTVTVLLAVGAVRRGTGLGAAGLPVLGLLVCVLCTAAGWRAGLLLTIVTVLALLVIQALVPGAPSLPSLGPINRVDGPVGSGDLGKLGELALGGHLIGIAAGLAAGLLIAQRMRRSLGAASDREQRFISVLGLAADGYWEIDAGYRLQAFIDHRRPAPRRTALDGVGQLPWKLPAFDCDRQTLDEVVADLDARVSFRDRRIRWLSADGSTRHYLASGAPRFDSRGGFAGYWGVVRDVSDVEAARAAVEANETRYQELFALVPTALVLHRRGRVMDANPAAVNLFRAGNLNAMRGTDILAHYDSGDSRERARRRIDALHAQPLGSALPVSDFKLHIDGRAVAVRATSASVQADGGLSLLSVFIDDTERLAAEQAVRRSEALLSHVVATSPDLITLTDLASGRYVMVNRSFERITGWTAVEAVGQTSMELGVWRSAEDRQRLVSAMQRDGRVDSLPMTIAVRGGRQVSMLISAARFVMDRRDYLVINGRDITQTERERLRHDTILAQASIGIVVTQNGLVVLANRHFERMFGFAEGEPLGRPANLIWRGSTPDTTAPTPRSAAQEAECDFEAALARGEPVELEQGTRRKDGSALTVRLRGRAIDPQPSAASDTVWILEDVTERREFEQALANARDAAEAANRAKTAFLANTSHELRTPLNGLIGLARMAGAPDVADANRARYLHQIVDSAQSLSAIISDILDLSKIEAGRLLIEQTSFGLGDALRGVRDLFAPEAAARHLDLQLELHDGVDGLVLGDPLRLRQVVTNYLGNAIKFTETGTIVLSARRLPDPRSQQVRIEVSDSGPGIRADVLTRLFKPFTQADESITRRYGGTGLGLSICSELALLMGGAVGVHSEPGEGSRFWLELPLPVAPAVAAAPRSAFEQTGLKGLRVLMVEDNPVNMLVAVSMLERWGVQATQAGDGRQALEAVQQAADAGEDFDAVLMDVQMPVMGGHEATRALRTMHAARTLPVIALTAAALISERENALRSGMNDFLTKPIDAQRLHDALLQWCRPDRGMTVTTPRSAALLNDPDPGPP